MNTIQDSRSKKDQEILTLSMTGADALMKVLDNPPSVNAELAQAAKHYKDSVLKSL